MTGGKLVTVAIVPKAFRGEKNKERLILSIALKLVERNHFLIDKHNIEGGSIN